MTFREIQTSSETGTSHYPYVDWLADWAFVDQFQVDRRATGHEVDPAKFRRHFDQKYGVLSGGRSSRLAAALAYIERHADELNEGIVAIVGKSVKSTNKTLRITFHVIYSQCPDENIKTDFAIDSVLALAREIAGRFVRSGQRGDFN